MADLIPRPSGRGGERGQLLLIAAFIVAVSFVALALVVNSAIFTENLATRDDVAGSEDALDHRHEVEQSIEETINEINQNNTILDDYSTSNLDTPVRENIEQIATQTGLQQTAQGRVVNITLDGAETGKKIAQDSNRTFSNKTGKKENWIIAENVNRTRNFRINITEPPSEELSGDPFTIEAKEGTVLGDPAWRLEIGNDPSSSDVEIRVSYGSLSTLDAEIEQCTREFDEYMIIDVTAGTTDGEPCHALTQKSDGTPMWFANNIAILSDYDIEFKNGNVTSGTYSFIIDEGDPEDDNLGNPNDDEPYWKHAIYSARVSYAYYTDDVGYSTKIGGAPGRLPP